ncbi:unnamed protein product, partial [Notodromas monacha]
DDPLALLSGSGTLTRRQEKLAKRLSRQAELKRLRMAQEIQRQLEELEVKQKELEERGVAVEKALRGEGNETDNNKEETELMGEWFALVHEKTRLGRYEQELLVRAKELELEDRQARLQQDLRERLTVDDEMKTKDDIEAEREILNEMMEIVEQRDTLLDMMEEDRLRYRSLGHAKTSLEAGPCVRPNAGFWVLVALGVVVVCLSHVLAPLLVHVSR